MHCTQFYCFLFTRFVGPPTRNTPNWRQGYIRFYWFLAGFNLVTRFYSVLLGSTGFYWLTGDSWMEGGGTGKTRPIASRTPPKTESGAGQNLYFPRPRTKKRDRKTRGLCIDDRSNNGHTAPCHRWPDHVTRCPEPVCRPPQSNDDSIDETYHHSQTVDSSSSFNGDNTFLLRPIKRPLSRLIRSTAEATKTRYRKRNRGPVYRVIPLDPAMVMKNIRLELIHRQRFGL